MTASGVLPIDEGSGPPLIVFHGWSGSHRNVLRWLPALTPHFRVLVPDLPGCNGTAPLRERHTGRSYARFGVGVLDSLGIGDVYAAGLCSGSAVAIGLAEAAPARLRGLLLHTPVVRPDLIRPLVRAQLGALASPVGALYGPLRRSVALTTAYRRLFASAGEIAAEQLAQDQADLVLADARASRELAADLLTGDRVGTLRTFAGPVGVLLAAGDAFVDARRTSEVIRGAAPAAATETIAGGHGWTPAYVAAQHAALERLAPYLLAAPAMRPA